MSKETLISIVSIIVGIISIIISIIPDYKVIIHKLIELNLDMTIMATIISYSLYLILLYCILKGINKVAKTIKEEIRNKNAKILKVFAIGSYLTVAIFKILLVCNTSNAGKSGIILFLLLLSSISYIIIYCLCVSDIYEICSFSSLFFVNKVNSKNIPYKIYRIVQIITIILILLIITEFVSVELGINFTKLFTS